MEKINDSTHPLQKIKDHIVYNLMVLQRDFGEKKDIILSYLDFFSKQDFTTKEQILSSFIAFLDMHFIDQIADQTKYSKAKNKAFLGSLYGRDRGSINMSQEFMTKNKVYIREDIKNKSGLFDTSLFDFLEQNETENYQTHRIAFDAFSGVVLDSKKLNIVYFNQPITFEQYFSLPDVFDQYKEKFICIGRVDLGDGLFSEFKIFNYKKGWGEKYHELFQFLDKHPGKPVVLPDIQSVIKKRLLLGLDIYGIAKDESIQTSQHDTKTQVQEILFHTLSKRSRRTFGLKHKITPEQNEEFIQNHIKHYERFFSDEVLGTPSVYLMNSGVSANDTVLTHIVREVPLQKWKCFDFYYENIPPFMRNHTDLNENTQVFLASPSILTPGPGKNMKKFTNDLKKDIAYFLENAKRNPEKKYYFVFDITTNLTLSLQDYFSEFPSNLTVVKTYSLTKHQRGDTQYFFGGAAIYNIDEEFAKTVDQTIEAEGYNLTQEQVIHYPRVRQSEIKRNMENIKKNRQAFKTGFTKCLNRKGMQPFAPEMIDSDYFSMIMIPLPEVLYYEYHMDAPSGKLSSLPPELEKHIIAGGVNKDCILGFHDAVVPSFIGHEMILPETTMKDTFGLTTHNLCAYFSNIGLLYYGVFNAKWKNIETPRVSFSIKKDIKGAYALGENFAKMYFSRMLHVRESSLKNKQEKTS